MKKVTKAQAEKMQADGAKRVPSKSSAKKVAETAEQKRITLLEKTLGDVVGKMDSAVKAIANIKVEMPAIPEIKIPEQPKPEKPKLIKTVHVKNIQRDMNNRLDSLDIDVKYQKVH